MPEHGSHLALFVKSLAGGGAQRVMLSLAESFAERGHRVDLVLARAEGPLLEQVPDAVRVVDLGTRGRLVAIPSLLRGGGETASLLASYARLNPPLVYGSVPALVRYLDRERPRGLLSAVDFTNLAALAAARIARAPARQVVSVHNPLSRVVAEVAKPRMRDLAAGVRRLFPDADAIVTCSRDVADDLARFASLPRERITPIGNPIVTPDLEPLSREPLDDPWLVSGAPPVVLGVGRLAKQKDFALLIRAFARLRERVDARLVILGEGPERAALEDRVRKLGLETTVRLPGFEPNPWRYLSRAALFVFSSSYEGFGNALVEAMACGCPVVSTDTGGPREILADGRFGALTPVGDDQRLCEAMAGALENPVDRELLVGRAGDFTAERSAERYLELLLAD